ncbi:MAG: ATPase, T2SS/T4P/T4SS family [Erysipelotrichaceae bacterium]
MEEKLYELLDFAISKKCSDIHLILKNDQVKISLRYEECLEEYDKSYPKNFINYLAYKANLDLGTNNKMQSGMFDYYYEYEYFAIRFSLINSLQLVSGVIRILNTTKYQSLYSLTLNETMTSKLLSLTCLNYGLVLICGPTGSGKTTTLYALAHSFKGKMVYSIEDPIEIYNDDFIQLQINEKMGITYQSGIKQIMRHDPDIIVIGEIRDKQAAMMACNAALTGHLVLATIHGKTGKGVYQRLLDFDINEDDIKEVLKEVVVQQLVYDQKNKRRVASILFEKFSD